MRYGAPKNASSPSIRCALSLSITVNTAVFKICNSWARTTLSRCSATLLLCLPNLYPVSEDRNCKGRFYSSMREGHEYDANDIDGDWLRLARCLYAPKTNYWTVGWPQNNQLSNSSTPSDHLHVPLNDALRHSRSHPRLNCHLPLRRHTQKHQRFSSQIQLLSPISVTFIFYSTSCKNYSSGSLFASTHFISSKNRSSPFS